MNLKKLKTTSLALLASTMLLQGVNTYAEEPPTEVKVASNFEQPEKHDEYYNDFYTSFTDKGGPVNATDPAFTNPEEKDYTAVDNVRNQLDSRPIQYAGDDQQGGALLWKYVENETDGYHKLNIGVKGSNKKQTNNADIDLIMVLDNSNSMYYPDGILDADGNQSKRMDILKNTLFEGGFFKSLNDGSRNVNVNVIPFTSRLQNGETHKVPNYLYTYILSQKDALCTLTGTYPCTAAEVAAGYQRYFRDAGKFHTPEEWKKKLYVDVAFPDNRIDASIDSFVNNGAGEQKFKAIDKLTTTDKLKQQWIDNGAPITNNDFAADVTNPAYFGATFLDAAIEEAEKKLTTLEQTRPNSKKIVLIVSDGAPTIATKIKNYEEGTFEPHYLPDGTPNDMGAGQLFGRFNDDNALGKHGVDYVTEDGVKIITMGNASVVRGKNIRKNHKNVGLYALGISLKSDPKAHVTKEQTTNLLIDTTDTTLYNPTTKTGRVYFPENGPELADSFKDLATEILSTAGIQEETFIDNIGENVELKLNDSNTPVYEVQASSNDLKTKIEKQLAKHFETEKNAFKVEDITLAERDWFNISYYVKPKDTHTNGEWLDTNGEAHMGNRNFPKPAIRKFLPKAQPSTTKDYQGRAQYSPITIETNKLDPKNANILNIYTDSEQAPAQINKDSICLMNGDDEIPNIETAETDEDNNNAPITVLSKANAYKKGTTEKIGEYTLFKDAAGNYQIKFKPNKDFHGEVEPVKIKANNTGYAKDDGSFTHVGSCTTTYTPLVEAASPTALPSKTRGPQGVEQTSEIILAKDGEDTTLNFIRTDVKAVEPDQDYNIDPSSITLLDANDNPTNVPVEVSLNDGTKVGKYELRKDGGKISIVFTPVDTFLGTAPSVKVRASDSHGISVETTYTPEVYAVTPDATASTTEDIQGKPQDSTIVIGEDNDSTTVNLIPGNPKVEIKKDSITLLDGNKQPSKKVEVFTEKGEKIGEYTLDGMTITFTPEKDFVGKAPSVTVQAKDKFDKVVTTTYTPTVIGVKPTALPSKTSGKQGQLQTSKVVLGNDTYDKTVNFLEGHTDVKIDSTSITLLDANNQPSKKVEVFKDGKKVGTYTLRIEGNETYIDFQPEPNFLGVAPAVRIQAKDKLGTIVQTTYTPTVIGEVPPVKKPSTPVVEHHVTQTRVPSTGDESGILLYVSLFTLSVIGIAYGMKRSIN